MIKPRVQGLDETMRKLKAANAKVSQALEDSVKTSTLRVFREARKLASGPIIKVRSGKTRARINWRFDKRDLEGAVGSPDKHMKQIEYGGTITPKRAQFLTIPFRTAQTRAGVTRKKITEYDDGFFFRKKGKLFFGREKGEGVEALFQLVRSVHQKPKWLFKTALDNTKNRIRDDSIKNIDRKLSEVFR